MAELLYDVNRRLGTITDYLVRQHGMALGDEDPKSVEVFINSVVRQAEADKPPNFEGGSGNIAGNDTPQPTELGGTTMSQ